MCDGPVRAPFTVIAPRQLIKATTYLRQLESGLPALASIPALIVWGTADFAFRDRERERFERAFPDHKTIQYPNASHFLQEDAGEQIAEQVTTFLRGLQAHERTTASGPARFQAAARRTLPQAVEQIR